MRTPKCQAEFMKLEQCITLGTPAACLLAFSTDGGPAASALSNCATSNCAGACGG